jgi:hypothetical protein
VINDHAKLFRCGFRDSVYRWAVHSREEIWPKQGRQSTCVLLRLDLGEKEVSFFVCPWRAIRVIMGLGIISRLIRPRPETLAKTGKNGVAE